MQQTPAEHPLNEQATEILEAMQVESDHSPLPILELIAQLLNLESHNALLETWMALNEMPEVRAMRLIEGRNQENELPPLTPRELEMLQNGYVGMPWNQSPRDKILIDLRRNLKNLLEEIKV